MYSTLTCTAHSASYIKALMYILLLEKYNTIHSVFLTWYQSHCPNFLVSCSLVLLVFSAASTYVVSKPFQCPLPTTPPLLEVLKVESSPPEAPPLLPKPLPSSNLSPLNSDQDIRHITG